MAFFIALAEELNYSRAAVRLGVSQPTLTQTVQKLEKTLEAELFEKSGNRMALTAEGRIFLDACYRITSAYKDAVDDIDNLRRGIEGRINLGIAPSRSPYTLPGLLDSFQEEYPNVRIDVEELLTAETEEGLIGGRLDLGLSIVNGIKKPELEYIPAIRERVLIAASRKLLERCGVDEAAVSGHRIVKCGLSLFSKVPFIMLGDEQFISSRFLALCAEEHVSPEIVARCKTVETGLALANSSRGAALVTSACTDYYSRIFPELRFFSVSEDKLDRSVYVMYRKEKALTGAEKRLIEIIKEKGSYHD